MRWCSLHNCTLSDPPPYLPGRFRSKSAPFATPVRPLTGIAVGVRSVGTGESELRKGAVSRSAGLYGHRGPGGRLSMGRPVYGALGRFVGTIVSMKQLFTCQSCQSRQATTTRGFGRAAFSRCRAVCSPLERPAISGRQSSVRRRKIDLCSPARSARSRGSRDGGRFGGDTSPESSVSRSSRSGRQSRRNGGGSRWGFRRNCASWNSLSASCIPPAVRYVASFL